MTDELEDLLKYIEEEDTTIWEIKDLFHSKTDRKILETVFTKDQQRVLQAIINKILNAVFEWHDEKDDECHRDIREKIAELEKAFWKHRHDFSVSYSGRPET